MVHGVVAEFLKNVCFCMFSDVLHGWCSCMRLCVQCLCLLSKVTHCFLDVDRQSLQFTRLHSNGCQFSYPCRPVLYQLGAIIHSVNGCKNSLLNVVQISLVSKK